MAKSVRDFKSLKECEAVAAENGKDMDLIAAFESGVIPDGVQKLRSEL